MKVAADSLLSALGPSADNNVDVRTVSKRLKQGDKEELAVPLEKVVQERIVRAAGYTGAKKEISVWDAVVHSRRAADQVVLNLFFFVLIIFCSRSPFPSSNQTSS